MKALLNYFVDLCLLRAAPQDLPASMALLVITTLLNILVGLAMIMDARMGLLIAFSESVFEAGLIFLALYVSLKLYQKLPRFQQTATAIMGSGLILGLLAMPLLAWSQRSESSEAGLLLLILVIWSMVVLGHILRHTFEISFSIGLAAAVLYTLVAWNLTFMFFPMTS